MAEDRTRKTAAKLHTAGPNMPDRDIRLDLLGPAAFGSGPSRSKECDHLEPCHDVDIDVLYPMSVYADIGIMKRRYQRFDL